MKNTIKKITLSAIALIAAFGVMANTASAGYYTTPTSLNEHPSDCPTVMIANHTTQAGAGSNCWATSIPTVQPGEIVNVMVYYHNTGYSTAHDVRVKLNNPSATGTSFSFSGSVSDSEGDHASGSVSMNISSSQALTFGSVKWYPNQSTSSAVLPYNQSGNEVFSSTGLRLGDLSQDTTSGFTNQGTIVVSFKAGNGGSTNGQQPTVSTYNYSYRNHTTGSVQLNGSYHGNGSDVTTWFRYRKIGQSWSSNIGSQSHGNTNGTIETTLTGLSTGSYEYQACAQNANGTKCGNYNPNGTQDENFTVKFTIDRGDGGCTNDCGCDTCDCTNDCNDGDLSIETKSADDIDEDSALLVGDINDIGSGDVTRWFEWDTNRNDVEDGDGSTLSLSGDTNSEGNFSKTLSGLQSDRTYYFRACAEDDNGDEDCGSVKSFTTDDDNNNGDDTDSPDITTLSAIAIGSTIATVDGFYDANGCSVTTWFEYGRTSSLGSSTARFNRGNGSGSMVYSFTSLAPSTTYYYRAVGSNCEGTVRGSIKNFTTNSGGTINPPVNPGTGGSGNSFIKLMIDNHRDTVRAGSEITYDVSWENITTRRLTDLILEINFPEQMIVIDTDRGTITRGGHSVIVEINELTSRETDDMTITAEVRNGLRDGDPVVAQAIMAFENPTTQATENAIGYDSDEFSTRTTGLGASLFGLSFLPGSLAGWLLILLIILIIIVLARHFMAQNQNRVTVNTQPMPTPVAPNNGTNGNDYIVYKPTPRV